MSRKDTPRKKPGKTPGESEPLKILRVTPQFHAAITEAGRPFGFSAQKTFDLVVSQTFGDDKPGQLNQIESRLRVALREMLGDKS